MATKVRFSDPDDLIRRYQSGTSLKKLSNETGYGRGPLLRLLTSRGVPIRGQSDAERLKWDSIRQTPDGTARQLAAAWKASRGRVDSEDVKLKRALGFYHHPRRSGRYELSILDVLTSGYGLDVSWQYPVNAYNVDLAVCPLRVAVEIQSDKHRMPTSSIRADRLEHILDQRWAVLVVYIHQGRTPDILRIAEQIHAFADRVRGNPTLVGQYGMIGSDGQPVTPDRFNFPNRPRIIGY